MQAISKVSKPPWRDGLVRSLHGGRMCSVSLFVLHGIWIYLPSGPRPGPFSPAGRSGQELTVGGRVPAEVITQQSCWVQNRPTNCTLDKWRHWCSEPSYKNLECFCSGTVCMQISMCVSAWQWNIFQLLHVLNPGEIRKSSRMISSTTGSFTAVALFSVYSCPGLPTQTLCPASSLGESNNWKQQRRNCLGFVFQGNEGTKNHQDVLVEDVAHHWGRRYLTCWEESPVTENSSNTN